MQQVQALVAEREVLPAGWERLTLHVPGLGGSLHPGQVLAIQGGASPLDPLLKQAFHLTAANATAGTAGLMLDPDVAQRLPHRAGDRVSVLGPIGRGWILDPRSRNLVLIGPQSDVGALLFLASTAAARSLSVALLVGADAVQPAFPAGLLPPAVEYQFTRGADAAASALELLDDALLRWADAIYTTLPLAAYPALADRIRGVRMRWEPGFAQGLLLPPMACFVGICGVCLIPEARRAWRACVEGPQCDLRDFVR